MRRSRRLISWMALLLLAATAWLSLARVQPNLSERQTPVSLENLRRHIAVIAAEPHPVGSEANHRVRGYVLGELRLLGLEPRVETGSIRAARGQDVTVQNILCAIPAREGAAEGGPILVTCHYDSHPRAPGAGDDGAAVASVLELARLLVLDPPAGRGVLLLLTDGEEAGLLGARVFARDHPDALGATLVLNFEGRGTSGPSVMFQTSKLTPEMLRRYAAASPHPVTSSLADEVYRRMPNDTDFTIFAGEELPRFALRGTGLPGLNFAFIGGAANYHTARDDPERLSEATLLHQAQQAWAVTRAMADGQPPERGPTAALVFFDVLSLGVVRYPQAWTWPIALIASAVAIVAARRLGASFWTCLRAAGRHLIALVAVAAWAGLIAWPAAPLDRAAHAWTWLAFAGAALLAVAALPWLARPGQRARRDADSALLFLLAGLAILTAWLMPAAAHLIVWPALFFGLAALARSPRRRPAALALSAALSTVLLLPLAWLVTVALTIQLLAVTGALLALLAWLWRPALEPLLVRRWTISVAAAGVALGMLVIVFFAPLPA